MFIANYLMTVGFMEALRQYRLRCPEDVALVTCDDYPWMDSFSPRLTTIDLPKRELGAAAARAPGRADRQEDAAAPRTVKLKNAMRVRESCGCGLRGSAALAGQMIAMTYDVLAVGRSSIDLYAHEIGRAIADVRSFDAYVGGCPTNVSVGTRRLGLRSALLTAVGDDQVGDFVTAFLDREQVETRFIPRKPGRRTSAVILTIQPPDKFPLTFYRDNCADRALTHRRRRAGAGARQPRRLRHRHRPQPRAGARRRHSRCRRGRARRRRAGGGRHRLPRGSMERARRRSRRRCRRCSAAATLAVGTEEELAAASGVHRRRRRWRRRCSRAASRR